MSAAERIGSSATRGFEARTKSAPTPFGPQILCAESDEEIDARRVDVERDLAGRLDGVRVKEDARALQTRAISATALSVPISLFAAMTVTRIVSGAIADGDRVRGRAAEPVRSDVRHAEALGLEAAARVEDGAVLDRGDDDVRRPSRAARARRAEDARLSASVAPDVKTISFAFAPTRSATCLARLLDGGRARQPEDVAPGRGVPEPSVKYGRIASKTRGSTGVVA